MRGGEKLNVTKVRYRPADWVTKADAQEILHCSHNTMARIIAEMESQVGSRYKLKVTADGITHSKLIDRLALNDYMRNRKALRNKIPVPPYDPKAEAWALGYYDQEVNEF